MSDERYNRYDDGHVGEKPVGWPRNSIEERSQMWAADEIADNIEKCRGCSNEYGLCDHHRGKIEGYDDAVADMTRSFDLSDPQEDGS